MLLASIACCVIVIVSLSLTHLRALQFILTNTTLPSDQIVEFIIIFVCLDALSLYLLFPCKRPSTDFSGNCFTVTRGKKKKKRKAFAKLALAGTLIKAKIELLLKILGAHLQIKFFAIALIGLLINIARFWIDVKRGGTPSKVSWRLPDEPNVFTLFSCSGTHTRFGDQTMFHSLYNESSAPLFSQKYMCIIYENSY